MQRGSQRGVIVACGVVAIAAVGAAVWWSVREGASATSVVPPAPATSRASPESPAARGQDASADRDAVGSLPEVTAERSAQEWSPLTLPPTAELDELELRSRQLLVGQVLDFDGAPCPGAAIWQAGERIATSDDAGCYRVEIEQRPPLDQGEFHPPWRALVAVKEGVGAGFAEFDERSGRLDLHLKWRTRLSGNTIVAGSGRVVPHAQIELAVFDVHAFGIAPWWLAETTSDAEGAYEFVGLPPTAVALRATAEQFMSAGWFVRSFGENDQLGVAFHLTRRVAIRGRFVPWPPYDGAVVADARVVAVPTRSGDVAVDMEKLATNVGADGTFELPVGESFDCRLHLTIGGGSLWRAAVEVPEGGGVVDLGVVALPAPAWIDLEVALPRELVELGVIASARSTGSDRLGWFRWPVGVDGRARLGPFDDQIVNLWVRLSDHAAPVMQSTLVFLERGKAVAVKCAPQLDRNGAWLLGGRVTHGADVPSPFVEIWLVVPWESGDHVLTATADREGRWLLTVVPPPDGRRLANGRSIELVAHSMAGVARRVVTASLPAVGAMARFDVALEQGATLRGVVVDAAGEPCAEQHLSLRPIGSDGEPSEAGEVELLLDDDGAFEVRSFEARDYVARIRDGREWREIGRVRPGGEPVTLRVGE